MNNINEAKYISFMEILCGFYGNNLLSPTHPPLLSAKVGHRVDYIMFVIFVPCIKTKSKIRLII